MNDMNLFIAQSHIRERGFTPVESLSVFASKHPSLSRTRRLVARPTSLTGFTLIETFVAITILITAIAGPLTLASRGLNASLVARDQLTASFLAQEGIEYIRHKRDTNSIVSASWLTGLSACTSGACMVDPKEDTISACGSTCDQLRLDAANGFYGYDLNDPQTSYVRSVRITPLASGYEALISVTVSWQTGAFSRSLTLDETITDWE